MIGFFLVAFLVSTITCVSGNTCFEIYGENDPSSHTYSAGDFRGSGDKCFVAYSPAPAWNINEARQYCENTFLEGDLATIHTPEDFDALASLAIDHGGSSKSNGGQLWLGLYNAQEPIMRYKDGSSAEGINFKWKSGCDSFDGISGSTQGTPFTSRAFVTIANWDGNSGLCFLPHGIDIEQQKMSQVSPSISFACQMKAPDSMLSGDAIVDNGKNEFQGNYDEVASMGLLLQNLKTDILDEIDYQQIIMNEAYAVKMQLALEYQNAVDDYHAAYNGYATNMQHLNEELEIIFAIEQLLGDQIGDTVKEFAVIEPINTSHELCIEDNTATV